MRLLNLIDESFGVTIYYNDDQILKYVYNNKFNEQLLPFKCFIKYIKDHYLEVSQKTLSEFFEEKVFPYIDDNTINIIKEDNYNVDISKIINIFNYFFITSVDEKALLIRVTFKGRGIMFISINIDQMPHYNRKIMQYSF